MKKSYFFVYILTNKYKRVIYIGVTNDLSRRLLEHETGKNLGFTHKYNCKYLIYYEQFEDIRHAISREKQLKHWCREKKEALINGFNPDWRFLNELFETTKP